jgi:hypothetical protein
MKVLETNSDIGSIRIYNDTMVIYLDNRIGDLPSKVVICESENKEEQKLILGELKDVNNELENRYFAIKTIAYLRDYDCGENPIYAFKPGRYHSVLYENATFLIEWIDNDI